VTWVHKQSSDSEEQKGGTVSLHAGCFPAAEIKRGHRKGLSLASNQGDFFFVVCTNEDDFEAVADLAKRCRGLMSSSLLLCFLFFRCERKRAALRCYTKR